MEKRFILTRANSKEPRKRKGNRMIIYIAGSFTTERERKSLEHMLELVKVEHHNDLLFIPMEQKVSRDAKKEDGSWKLSNPAWAQEVFQLDRNGLTDADRIIAMYTGHWSTTGTSWEIGYAYGKGIPITLYIPEWAKEENVSLMVLNSASSWMDEQGHVHPITFEWLNQFNQK